MDLPRIIGHRGAAAVAPENTLAGFAAAKQAGAGWVEFDVRLTRDQVPVLLHDATLERTTNGRGRLSDLDWSDLAGLDAGDGAGAGIPGLVPTLVRLQAWGLGVNIELKADPGREIDTAQGVARAVRAGWADPGAGLVLTSFSETCLAALAEAAPDLPRGYLVERLPEDWAARADRLGCVAVSLGDVGATPEAIRGVKRSGRALMVWTVNNAVRAQALLNQGVDANISDDPGMLIAALEQKAADWAGNDPAR